MLAEGIFSKGGTHNLVFKIANIIAFGIGCCVTPLYVRNNGERMSTKSLHIHLVHASRELKKYQVLSACKSLTWGTGELLLLFIQLHKGAFRFVLNN